MLRMVLGDSWKDKVSKDVLHGKLPKLSYKIRSRISKMAGHYIRHPEPLANDLVTWEPEASRGETKRGRPRHCYLPTNFRHVGIPKEELQTDICGRSDLAPN